MTPQEQRRIQKEREEEKRRAEEEKQREEEEERKELEEQKKREEEAEKTRLEIEKQEEDDVVDDWENLNESSEEDETEEPQVLENETEQPPVIENETKEKKNLEAASNPSLSDENKEETTESTSSESSDESSSDSSSDSSDSEDGDDVRERQVEEARKKAQARIEVCHFRPSLELTGFLGSQSGSQHGQLAISDLLHSRSRRYRKDQNLGQHSQNQRARQRSWRNYATNRGDLYSQRCFADTNGGSSQRTRIRHESKNRVKFACFRLFRCLVCW